MVNEVVGRGRLHWGWESRVVAPRGEALPPGQGVLRFNLEVMMRV